jgi:hypothetical protein
MLGGTDAREEIRRASRAEARRNCAVRVRTTSAGRRFCWIAVTL